MIDEKTLLLRYFPNLPEINLWIKLAQYYTQKTDIILTYDHAPELLYSYFLYSLTDTGFTLVFEEEKFLPILYKEFGTLKEFVFLSIQDEIQAQKKAIENIQNNIAKIVVTSIDRFFQKGNKFLEYLKSYQLQQIAIHHAEYLSFWGCFQENYLQLSKLKKYLTHVPIIAVTPVLTESLQKEIISSLSLYEPILLLLNTLADNVTFSVIELEDAQPLQAKIENCIDKHPLEKGLIFSPNFELDFTLAQNVQVVQTLPESMKADFVILNHLPQCLEDLYTIQQVTQAKSVYVVYSAKQAQHKKEAIQHKKLPKAAQHISISRFEQVLAWINTQTCRKQFLQKYWQMPITEPCQKCDRCQSQVSLSVNLNSALKQKLIQQRLSIAKRDNLLLHQVFSDDTIDELATYLPQNKEDLIWIKGLGSKKIELYGDELLDTIIAYCAAHKLNSNINSLKSIRKNISYACQHSVSVVKKAKIKAAIQELGYWDIDGIKKQVNDEQITIPDIESVISTYLSSH
ncbi:MAG: HRDC domain-containing protein [Bacteroidia bacterium]|nr:HRDC domain-containing protein [Bacteroidia bacterium]